MNLHEFDWGNTNKWYRETINREIFEDRIYEKVFKVKEGDIVVDFGTSIGPFAHTLKDKKITHVYCIEPSESLQSTLEKNLNGLPYTIVPKAVGGNNELIDTFIFFEDEEKNGTVPSITFKTLIDTYNIPKIDFLKTDCEGGEYDVFSVENMHWLKQNLGYAVGEWHLGTPSLKTKFRAFRDVFLRIFPNHHVYSVDGVDIKWDLWNEHFIEYYTEVIIHIDNKS
jgi:FkbM family methyltransferase